MTSDGAGESPAPVPGEFVCLDAGVLIHFNRIGELDLLGTWLPGACVPEYVLQEEIVAWTGRYRDNELIASATWLRSLPADTTADAAMIATLSVRFARSDTKSVGELHVIALTKRYKGTAIIEDGQARHAARDPRAKVKSTFWVSMLGAAAVSGLLADDDAWDLQRRLEEGRDRSVIRSGNKRVFTNLLSGYRDWANRHGWRHWPLCLHNNGLDLIAIAAAKDQLDQPGMRKRLRLD